MSQLPRWARENYPGSEEDYTEWLRQGLRADVFAAELEAVVGDKAALATVEAKVEHMVMSRTKDHANLSDRAFLFQYYSAQRTGWPQNLPGEFDTPDELLASMIDEENEGTTRWKNLTFIADKIVPLAKQYEGVEAKELWSIPLNISKAIEAVPGVRHILKNVPEDEVEPQIIDVIKKIADPTLSVRVMREEIRATRGKQTKTIAPMRVTRHHMSGGEEWLVVRAPTRAHARAAHARAAEIAVKDITVEIDTRDPLDLYKELRGRYIKSIQGVE
jgi:hypothetical protein